MDRVEKAVRNMNAETLKSELERRGLQGVAENTDARVDAILKNERAKIEAGD